MNLSRPLENLLGKNTARILRRVALVNSDLTGRHIARLADVPVASASLVLANLVGIGLLTAQDAGPSRLYRLNRDHVLWQPINDLMATSSTIEDAIAEIVRGGVGDRATVALFGSFARGTAGSDSDIDLLIVWDEPVAEDERYATLDALQEEIPRMTGNRLDIIELFQADLDRLIDHDDPLVESWREDARTILGVDVTLRLKKTG
jgi:predicted nucleotidyltransferase